VTPVIEHIGETQVAPRRRLVLVGAGGAGREVLAMVRSSPDFVAAHRIDDIVFIDDALDRPGSPAPVVSSVDAYIPAPDDLVLVTIGEPRSRAAVVGRLIAAGAVFATFVHDTAVLLPGSTIGEGSVVYPFVVVSTDVSVGAHTWLQTSAVLGHDVVVGDVATVCGGAHLLGGVRVGDRAFVATGAVVHPGVEVGESSRVGAGSVVLRRVRRETTVFGVPAVMIPGAAR
jgi:sugar O-acyltransferase (sialic acid O-acetyltransferase NeuD family)